MSADNGHDLASAGAALDQAVEVGAARLVTAASANPGDARPSATKYPPTSSLPRTSRARLDAAAPPPGLPQDAPYLPVAEFPEAVVDDAAAANDTALYLAFGSNLCAKTFQGMRGIRPLSRVNVTAPTLSLVFDLPGMPYLEPCFANSALRRPLPRPLPKPPVDGIPGMPSPPAPAQAGDAASWNKGLVGVVYEVTREDFAKILATEGGGTSYQDILVPCIEIPPGASVPEAPAPGLPRPFLAHTLFAPPDDSSSSSSSSEPPAHWYTRFLAPRRRANAGCAQPSARYLGLIRTGARENDLPAEYQEWLAGLPHYRPTTLRQRAGGWVVRLTLYPAMMALFMACRVLADPSGMQPLWMRVALGVLFTWSWALYDAVLRPVFGDGERTVAPDDDDDDDDDCHDGDDQTQHNLAAKRTRMSRRARSFGRANAAVDEEKRPLLDNVR